MAEHLGTYYRQTGNHDYCGCEILPPPSYEIERIIIERIQFHKEIRINGQKKQNAFVAYFSANPYTTLPFCLNSTNAKRLAKQSWNTIVEDGLECQGRIDLLKNFPVRLNRELTRDPSDGGQIYGLRISKYPAADAPESSTPVATPAAQKKVITEAVLEKTVAWAKGKGMTFEQVAEIFDFEGEAIKDAVADALSPEVPVREPGNEDDLPQ